MKTQRGLGAIPIIIILAILIGGVYVVVGKPFAPENPDNLPPTTDNPTADWQTYRNEEYGFEFKHPSDHVVTTNDQGNGVSVFRSGGRGEVFTFHYEPQDLGNQYNFRFDGNGELFKQIFNTFKFTK